MIDPWMQPLLFEPLFRERIWGGRRLESLCRKKLPAGKCIGESWEIVDRADAQSVVRQGPHAGRTLHDLWRGHRSEIFGDEVVDSPRFPVFAKLLDAREKLSLQVHPPADVAAALGGEAKTEMWYVAAAEPGTEIFLGLRRGVSQEDFARALNDGTATQCLHRLEVKCGDVFFVPSGRLHAIGAGLVIVEIQENSDTTYRVFDWNRRSEAGSSRPLQIEEAMRSIDFADIEPQIIEPDGELLVRTPHFTVEKWSLTNARPALDHSAAALFVCLRGTVAMAGMEMHRGDFFLVPAGATEAPLEPRSPQTDLLRVALPSR